MTETAIVICVALCMFLEGELVEHTYKASMSDCLKAKREAETVAKRLVKASCTVAVPVGEEDRIFGSVTAQQVSDLLKEQGFDVDRRIVQLEEPIRALGVYDVPIQLHVDVIVTIKVWVVKE